MRSLMAIERLGMVRSGGSRILPRFILSSAISALFVLPAAAQTALPGIVITNPSPVDQAPVTTESSTPVQVPPTFSALIIADESFVPVTVVTEQDVLATQGATITDTLQDRPGITGTTFAGGANRPIIRGLDNGRVRVQENGVSTHDVSTLSEDHAIPIDPNAVRQIEVIRGPATLRFGSQAIGGVVAVETDRIPTSVPRNGFTAEVKGGYSSVDDGADGSFATTMGAQGFVIHADGFVRSADDYDTPRGKQFNTFVDSDGFALGFSLVGRNGFVGVSYTEFNSLYGIPGEEAAEKQPRIELQQKKVQAKGELRVGDFGIDTLRFWFGTTDYTHDEVIFEDGEGDIVGTRFNNLETEARVELQHTAIETSLGRLKGALGVQASERRTTGFGVAEPVDGLLDPAQTRSIAGFLFEELQVSPNLRLQAAGRVERTTVDGRGITDFSDVNNPIFFDGERSFTPVSGSVGALLDMPMGLTASLTLQHTERAPEAQELYSKGVHEATETFEIGNPLLDTEEANSIELGLKKSEGRFRFDSALFYTRFEGFIFKQLTGVGCGETLADCGVEDELDQIVFQQRKATFHGLEIAAQLDVAPVWNGIWGIDGQYDFVRARFEGDNVPRIPPHRLGGGIYYRDTNWFARLGVLHAFDQDDVNAESDEEETPGYTLINAELSYTDTFAGGALGSDTQFTFGVRGENLGDEEVLNHASFKRRDEVLLPGASVKVFGKIKLN
ncbi:MAG: TonB-dependent receptor [Pseudomonadota bacterium]